VLSLEIVERGLRGLQATLSYEFKSKFVGVNFQHGLIHLNFTYSKVVAILSIEELGSCCSFFLSLHGKLESFLLLLSEGELGDLVLFLEELIIASEVF